MSAVSSYDSGEIALGFSYVTLVEQVANLSITLLAIGTQLADVQTALIQSPFYDKDSLHSEIEKQLQEMQSNEQIVKARLEEILEQLKKVLFMTTQLSLSTQIEYHLSAFNRSGLDVMMAQLPGVIADAAYEIDSIQKRVHQEIQILSDNNNLSLGNTDIDKMLEEGKKKR
jgi:hypothetical protein